MSQFSFRYYLAGVGASQLCAGLHAVIYPWIVIGILEQSPSRLGLAQMAMFLPTLLFLLPGGVVSDRRHAGSWLGLLYLLYAIPLMVLVGALILGELSFSLLLMFGLGMGTVTAFVQPARENLLGMTPSAVMQQAVARTMTVHFVAQSAGYLLAGQLERIGLVTIVVLQVVLYVLSSFLFRRSHPEAKPTPQSEPEPEPEIPQADPIGQLFEGVKLCFADRSLRDLLLMLGATGMLGLGVYLVGMPILVRESYAGGADFFALVQLVFSLGIISTNVYLGARTNLLRRAGRLMIASLLIRALLLGLISMAPAKVWLFVLLFAWGSMSGLSMTLGRSILHSRVPDSHRSRAVSVYQMFLFGSAPLGAWLSGVTINYLGVENSLLVISIATGVVATVVCWRSPLWRDQQGSHSESTPEGN